MNYFFVFSLKKNNEFNFFFEVCIIKSNKDKSTETFPPSILYILYDTDKCERVQCQKLKKVSKRFQF